MEITCAHSNLPESSLDYNMRLQHGIAIGLGATCCAAAMTADEEGQANLVAQILENLVPNHAQPDNFWIPSWEVTAPGEHFAEFGKDEGRVDFKGRSLA